MLNLMFQSKSTMHTYLTYSVTFTVPFTPIDQWLPIRVSKYNNFQKARAVRPGPMPARRAFTKWQGPTQQCTVIDASHISINNSFNKAMHLYN